MVFPSETVPEDGAVSVAIGFMEAIVAECPRSVQLSMWCEIFKSNLKFSMSCADVSPFVNGVEAANFRRWEP